MQGNEEEESTMKQFPLTGKVSFWAECWRGSCNHSSSREGMLNPFNCVWLFVILWTVAHQAPLSTGFSRQEYWSGLPCTPLGDLTDPEIKPTSPASLLQVSCIAGGFFTTAPLEKPLRREVSQQLNLGHWEAIEKQNNPARKSARRNLRGRGIYGCYQS